MSPEEALIAFLTPPKPVETSREAELVALAERSRLCSTDQEIEVYTWGQGKPVLFVHGWGGRGTQFAAFVPPLIAAGFRVVAFDGPGHGRSSGLLSSGPAIAAAAQAVGEREGRFAAIIGHSIGSAACAIALHRGMAADCVVFLGACCWILPTIQTFAALRELDEATERGLLHLFQQQFDQEVLSVEAIAPSMTMPLRLFHDRDDREMPFADSEAIAKAWPGAELIEAPGQGHRRILRSQKIVEQAVQFISG